MRSKKPEKDWLEDGQPKSKWDANAAVGYLPKIIKKVAKYHATRGRKKV